MGPAVPPRRRDGERRVLLLGDSFVLGHTVFPRHYFGRYLEDDLAHATGEKVRVLNFAKADFNFSNMYEYYRDFAGTFDHDLALFFIDEEDITASLQIATGLYPVVKAEGDSLVIDRSFRSSSSYRFYKLTEPLFTHSAVLRLVFNSYKVGVRGEMPGVMLDKLAPRPHRRTGPPAPKPEPALSPICRAIFRDLRRDPRNVLVIRQTLPSGLRREVDASGMPVLDLGAYLDSLKAAGADPYYWPISGARGHWNHTSQPMIARYLADHLLAARLAWPGGVQQHAQAHANVAE
jgi:hypothetical protein